MAFGRKTKKEPVAQPTAPDGATSAGAQKKRKPTELLRSVVNESALGAAVDLMKRNEAFALPNETGWVTLLLSVDDIGGLSQKQKNDSAKGSIIELIRSDRIEVVATKEMLDRELLAIVPTPDTLNRMNEYSLLTGAPYLWAVLRLSETDGAQTLTADAMAEPAEAATYFNALAVSTGDRAIADFLPDVWAWAAGTTEDEADQTEVLEPVREPVAVGAGAGGALSGGPSAPVEDDPLADVVGEPIDYEALAQESTLEAHEAEFDQSVPETVYDDGEEGDLTAGWDQSDDAEHEQGEGDPDAYLAYVQANRSRVVDEAEVRDTIARRFLSSDLDLVVDLAEFETTFATNTPAISIAVSDDPSDWIGSQVAQHVRQGNAELELMHRTHDDALRELYVETMALHVEKTMEVVSTERPGSQFYELMAGAKKDLDTMRASAAQEVAAHRKEITERFHAAARSRGEQAAAHARAQYEDKNRPKLERDLAEAGVEMDRRHEEQYNHNRKTVLELRRKDANVRMDLGMNRIFELLRERQGEQREAERALLEQWTATIREFIDDNRKNDVARAQALADSLARENQVEAITADYNERMAEQARQSAQRVEELNGDLVRIREEAARDLERYRVEWDNSLNLERERVRAGTALTDQLAAQVSQVRDETRSVYEARIATLEADKAAQSEDMARINVAHRRMMIMVVVLILALTLAGLLAGIVGGYALHSAQESGASAQALAQTLTGPAAWSGS